MWRKALRIFNKLRAFVCTTAVICASSLAFAQDITMPTMPTISSPTMGGSFYAPSQNMPYLRPAQTGTSEKKSTNNTQTENAAPKQEEKQASKLTASEIATMGNMGLLNGLNSVYSSRSYLSGTIDVNEKETNNLLRQILTEMENIQEQNKEATDAAEKEAVSDTPAQNIVTPNARPVSAKENAAHSRLLRFNVNGYDVLKTCRTVYISDMHSDGSFLVTGDRKYLSDGKVRNETFHVLFTTDKTKDNSSLYKAAAEVNQDYFNQYSFLYELSRRNDLTAFRTGNLVTMKTSDPQWKLDMLIDLGE